MFEASGLSAHDTAAQTMAMSGNHPAGVKSSLIAIATDCSHSPGCDTADGRDLNSNVRRTYAGGGMGNRARTRSYGHVMRTPTDRVIRPLVIVSLAVLAVVGITGWTARRYRRAMSRPMSPAPRISISTAARSRSRILDRCGFRRRLSRAGLRIGSEIGSGPIRGGGLGSMTPHGDGGHSTTAVGPLSAARGDGGLVPSS